MAETLLEVCDLHVVFERRQGTVHAVRGANLTLRAGQTLGLVGESGSGKSVTALSILRLLGPNGRIMRGAIRLRGRDLLTLGESEMRRIRGNEIAMIFQEPMTALNPVLTCGEQIAEVYRVHQRIGRRDAAERAVTMLERVHLPDPEQQAHRYPHQLSGGMRQRVMIAMALACRPSLLIADEPTTALDVTVQAQILQLLVELQARDQVAILLITHDLGVVAESASHVAIMRAGEVVEHGAIHDVLGSPQHAYTRALLDAAPRLRWRAGESGSQVPAAAALGPTPLLEVRDLHARYVAPVRGLSRRSHEVHALRGVSFDVAPAETLGIVGESGSGKTTLARAILRLIEPTSGSVRFAGADLLRLGAADLRRTRRHLQVVFQDPHASLNPRLRVGDAIAEPLWVHRVVPRRQCRDRALELLEMVGLGAEQMDRYPHELSGGQRQRVGIARALSVEPRLVVCDEPVSSLDVTVQAQILALLRQLRERFELAYVFISHDLRVVSQLCDRVAVMSGGEILEVAPTVQLFRSPKHEYTRRLLAACPPDPRRIGSTPGETSGGF